MTGKRPQPDGKKEYPKKMKKFEGISQIVLILLFVLFVSVGGSLFLLSMDKYHDCYQSFIINYYLKGNNYYDGTAWLTVTATLIGAVISAMPGLLCGILALMQTERLHMLEARYHRPSLEVENVEISFARLDHIYKDDKFFLEGFDRQQRLDVIEAKEQKLTWWMDLKADLFLNNEIPLQDMEIESVTFSFPKAFLNGVSDRKSNKNFGKEYQLSLPKSKHNEAAIRSFERKLKNSHAAYTFLCCMNPFVLEDSGEDIDFDKSIDQFVYYDAGRDPGHWQLDLTVAMNITYDYMEQESKRCLLRIAFEADAEDNATDQKPAEPNQNIIKKRSANGYITYEV